MTRLGVDLETLDDFTAALLGCQRELDHARERIDTAVGELHAEWRGVAATAHADAHRRWAAGEAEMRSALTALQQIAATASGNYAAAITAGARMWAC